MNLLDLLSAKFANQSATATAAALGLSKQAYAQARARGRLSEPAAIRAAELLNLDPGAALLANTTRQHPAPPVSNPTPPASTTAAQRPSDNTNYAN